MADGVFQRRQSLVDNLKLMYNKISETLFVEFVKIFD